MKQKICCHTFLCSHKFHKIVNYFSFEVLKKKIWPNFQRIIELFTQKIVTPSEIRDPEKTYSGSRIQGSKRHRIPDPDPQHWYQSIHFLINCLAGKTVYPYGLIDTNFAPLQFLLDSALNLAVNISRFYLLKLC